jgi:putative phage-type endonuclease
MLTTEQLEERRTGIGGSDVASIVGLSPWKTANAVYLEKRGEIEDEDISEKPVIIFGNMLEQVVADFYTRQTGEKLEKRNKLIRHKKYPQLIANIDRKIVGRPAVFEAKTADKFTIGKWGEDGSDDVPEHYRVQVEHYFNVTGYDEGVLAVLIGGNEFRQYPITRDQELSEMLMEQCLHFWEKVEKGFPPEIDFAHANAIDTIKRMYPGTDGTTIVLPKELEHWHKVKVDADKEITKYKNVSDTCKARILAAMGEAAVGQFPDIAYQYKRSETKRKEYVVEATSYFQMRGSAIRGAK